MQPEVDIAGRRAKNGCCSNCWRVLSLKFYMMFRSLLEEKALRLTSSRKCGSLFRSSIGTMRIKISLILDLNLILMNVPHLQLGSIRPGFTRSEFYRLRIRQGRDHSCVRGEGCNGDTVSVTLIHLVTTYEKELRKV